MIEKLNYIVLFNVTIYYMYILCKIIISIPEYLMKIFLHKY